QSATHQYTAPGTYNVSLIAGNTLGCKDTATKQITIKETPNASFTAPNVCYGSPTVFTYTGTGTLTAYNWNYGSNGATSTAPSPNYIYTAAGTYTATLVAEINGCFDTVAQTTTVNPTPVATTSNDTMFCTSVSTFQLMASGGDTYIWSPATGLSDVNIANPMATLAPPAAVTYTVVVTNQFQCTDTESVSIGFFPITQVNAGIDTSICLNPGSYRDSVQLTATGMVSYQWSPANTLTNGNIANPVSRPAVNTTYLVTGTDANGCRSVDSVTVFVLDPLLNIIVDDVANICIGDTGFLNVINQGASSYTWSPNQFIVNGSSYSPGFYPPDTTVYYLNVDNYCYMKNDSVIINVQQLPVLSFIVPDSLCTRDVETLTVSGAQSYMWDADSTLTAGINTATPTIVPDSSQYYYVTATSQFGCVRYDSVFVTVHQLPYVYAGDDTLIYRETEGVLNGITAADWYEWSPKTAIKDVHDLNSLINPTTSIQYLLTAIDTNGCVNRDSVIVTVEVLTIVDLPTAFSPNGDGLNDVFHIVRWLNIERIKEFAVYNRWGNKVFSTTNILDGWNGYYLDMEQPVGTYVWMVIANTRDNQEVLHKGNVTLVR
ncbi:MAG: gliding motility-associated C-terminal domain-containing protein, partial [Bacteroidetes bacterium]|nr:gliding motility-associated C-terminal domain-containing protein [Bacteroidota bacterium]